MMKKKISCLLILGSLLLMLTGCSFLNREYSSIEAHSATYYESEDRSILRAESYQDLVNDLLVLVSGHKEQGRIRLSLPDAEAAMEQAAHETQFETPLGAYAVEYITYTLGEDSGLTEVSIGYRRSAEQMAAIIYGNSVSALLSALPSLLSTALENGDSELALQVSYFQGQTGEVEEIIEQVRQEQEITEPWTVNYYPDEADVGIIEILFEE